MIRRKDVWEGRCGEGPRAEECGLTPPFPRKDRDRWQLGG